MSLLSPTTDDLLRRRQVILERIGLTGAEFEAAKASRSLTGAEWEAKEKIDAIDFLLHESPTSHP